ncbi:MAG: CPBP family intramembrane metalloprotease [Kiritimatiellaeota bacterium]|nr:CPBP family intramembrane metalloprotease [Kiritimatiellota bacterium]
MLRRWIEFCVLYLFVPVFLAGMLAFADLKGLKLGRTVIPLLMVLALAMLPVLRRDEEFDFGDFVRVRTVPRREWLMMFARFVCGAAALTLILLYKNPDALLVFPKTNLRFWILVMVCYPVFSVLAQGVVYRALYWSRYSRLFPERLRIVVGAAVFAFAHLAYANVYALAFPFIGGLMFLSGYRRTRSLMFAAIEHALYGDFLFTIGWGYYFFNKGIMRMLENT